MWKSQRARTISAETSFANWLFLTVLCAKATVQDVQIAVPLITRRGNVLTNQMLPTTSCAPLVEVRDILLRIARRGDRVPDLDQGLQVGHKIRWMTR